MKNLADFHKMVETGVDLHQLLWCSVYRELDFYHYNEKIGFEVQQIHIRNEIEISVSLHDDSLYMYVFHWPSSGQLEARYPNAYSILAT